MEKLDGINTIAQQKVQNHWNTFETVSITLFYMEFHFKWAINAKTKNLSWITIGTKYSRMDQMKFVEDSL